MAGMPHPDTLVQQLRSISPSLDSASLQRIGSALTFLQQPENAAHWWCQHGDVAAGLLIVLAFHDQSVAVQSLAQNMGTALLECPSCVVAYHQAQGQLKEGMAGEAHAAAALATLQHLDEELVAAALTSATATPSADIPPAVVTALFEVLSFEGLMDDAATMGALEAALLALNDSHDLALTEGGRYPGIYRLMAHGNPKLRALIGPIVRGLGPFEDEADVECIFTVLQRWIHTLEFDLFEAQPPLNGRERWQQPRQALWQALNTLLSLMRGPAMGALLAQFPGILDAAINFVAGGSAVSWPALGCLRSILQTAQAQAWQHTHFSPESVTESLTRVLLHTLDARLQANLIAALKAVAVSLQAWHGQEPLRRRILEVMLHQIASAGTVSQASIDIAQHAALDVVRQSLQAGPQVRADLYVFGPILCRLVATPQAVETEAVKLARQLSCELLLADSQVLATLNEALSGGGRSPQWNGPQPPGGAEVLSAKAVQQDREAPLTFLCSPALWKGLAATADPQVSTALLCALANLAHVTAAQGSSKAQGGAGFHSTPSAMPEPLHAAQEWPRQADPAAPHPSAVRAAEYPGLLLQALRQATCSHLTAWHSRAVVEGSNETQRGIRVEALIQLMVGLNGQLRQAAEDALMELAERATLSDTLSSLMWSASSAGSVFVGLQRSCSLLRQCAVPQALVREDTKALLSQVKAVLLAAEDLSGSVSRSCRALADAAWAFLNSILEQGRQVARFAVAQGCLQKAFELIPVVWPLVSGGKDTSQFLTAQERQRLRAQLGWMAPALQWGGSLTPQLAPQWASAIHKVLLGLPEAADRCLPPEAMRVAVQAMTPESGVPDAARLLLAPLLRVAAPGNLGQSPLAGLPSRAKLALPTAPGRAAGQAPALQAGAKASEPEVFDLTLEDDDAPTPSSRRQGEDASQSSMPGWMALGPTGGSAGRGGAADGGYKSDDVPLKDVLTTQAALWEASRQGVEKFVNGRGPDRSAPRGVDAREKAKGARGQKSMTAFVSVSPHKKGEPKAEIPKPHKAGGIDMDKLWAQAEKAEAERMQQAQKSKSGGLPRLKAMLDRADAEQRDAERRLPRSERSQPTLPARHTRTPPEPLQAPPRRAPVATAKLQEDDALGAQLGTNAELPAPRLPEGRTRLGLPAVPKVQRKAIQLTDAPGAHDKSMLARKKARAAASAASEQVVLTMDEVYRDILSWDFYGIISGRATRQGLLGLGKVPTFFEDLQHYSHVFWALLLEELRAHIQQAHEEGPEPVKRPGREAPVGGNGNVIGSSVALEVKALQRRSQLHRVEFGMAQSDRDGCRMDDLVLLTKTQPPTDRSKASKPPPVHLLALIKRVERDETAKGRLHVTGLVNLLSGNPGADGKRLEGALHSLLPGTTWRATRLLSWTPHHRQFQALCKAYLLPAPLLEQLLHPQPPQGKGPLPGTLARCQLAPALVASLAAAYNTSQQVAIASCISGSAQFALIQGPPGTGKTSTVIAVISAILAKQPPAQPAPQAAGNGPTSSAQVLQRAEGDARVLVCAQSNAAIDELISRLADPGIFDSTSGERRVPNLVRLGKVESAHESIKSYHIDAVADKFASADEKMVVSVGEADRGKRQVVELREQLAAARKALDEAEAALGGDRRAEGGEGEAPGETAGSGVHTAGALGALRDNRRRLALQLKAAQEQAQRGGEQVTRARREVRQAVLRKAEVVACTLSAAGGDLLSLAKGSCAFTALIIDEAAQALEPAVQVALQLICPAARIVLVGDPKQLPATVISRAAEAGNLTQSLFERLQQAKWPVTMLSEQYRMHPAISAWPAKFFYDGKLVNGLSVEGGACAASFHAQPCFQPLAVFDCREGRESSGTHSRGGSLSNPAEADLICELLKGLVHGFPEALTGTVVVLTPYRAQLSLLRSRVSSALDRASLQHIEFATVDGFQGKEADVVVFSCVRARAPGTSSSVGFLADVRRMNVGLTRARRGLWVVGHLDTLQGSPPWAALVEHARQHKCLFAASPPYSSVLAGSRATLTAAAISKKIANNAMSGGKRKAEAVSDPPAALADGKPPKRAKQRWAGASEMVAAASGRKAPSLADLKPLKGLRQTGAGSTRETQPLQQQPRAASRAPKRLRQVTSSSAEESSYPGTGKASVPVGTDDSPGPAQPRSKQAAAKLPPNVQAVKSTMKNPLLSIKSLSAAHPRQSGSTSAPRARNGPNQHIHGDPIVTRPDPPLPGGQSQPEVAHKAPSMKAGRSDVFPPPLPEDEPPPPPPPPSQDPPPLPSQDPPPLPSQDPPPLPSQDPPPPPSQEPPPRPTEGPAIAGQPSYQTSLCSESPQPPSESPQPPSEPSHQRRKARGQDSGAGHQNASGGMGSGMQRRQEGTGREDDKSKQLGLKAQREDRTMKNGLSVEYLESFSNVDDSD